MTMEKFLFCVKCKSPMVKIELVAEDILIVQKFLTNQSEFNQLKSKNTLLLFSQWGCKCGSKIVTVGYE